MATSAGRGTCSAHDCLLIAVGWTDNNWVRAADGYQRGQGGCAGKHAGGSRCLLITVKPPNCTPDGVWSAADGCQRRPGVCQLTCSGCAESS